MCSWAVNATYFTMKVVQVAVAIDHRKRSATFTFDDNPRARFLRGKLRIDPRCYLIRAVVGRRPSCTRKRLSRYDAFFENTILRAAMWVIMVNDELTFRLRHFCS